MGDIKQWRDNTKGIETFLKLFTKRNERIAKSLRESYRKNKYSAPETRRGWGARQEC